MTRLERQLLDQFRGLSLVGQATVLASTEALLVAEARQRAQDERQVEIDLERRPDR